jgi:hypothetical protein
MDFHFTFASSINPDKIFSASSVDLRKAVESRKTAKSKVAR